MRLKLILSLLIFSLGANVYLGLRAFLHFQTGESQARNRILLETREAAVIDNPGSRTDSEALPSAGSDSKPVQNPSPTADSPVVVDSSAAADLPPAGYARLFLKDVRFYWNDQVYADVETANAFLKSSTPDGLVDFDAPETLQIQMQAATVAVDFTVLEALMGRVFGHPDSHVRNMAIDSVRDEESGEYLLRIVGELELITWLDFEMLARVQKGSRSGTIQVQALKITSLGLPFVKGLMGSVGMELESLIVPAPDTGVTVSGNTIEIYVPEFFPAPTVHGAIAELALSARGLALEMEGRPLPADLNRLLPDPGASHYLFAAGRFVKFGPLRLIATSLQMIDISQEDLFHFHMQ